MVSTHSGNANCAADTLLQLASIVETSGMTPREFGAYLTTAIEESGEFLSGQCQADLLQLCRCDSSPTEFAQGLRRQAEQLRSRLAG